MMSGVTSLTGVVQDLFNGECRVSTFDRMPQIVTGEVSAEDAVAEGIEIYNEQKAFDLPWIMFLKGMPLNSTWLTSTYMYYHACESRNTDYGCAVAVLIVIPYGSEFFRDFEFCAD